MRKTFLRGDSPRVRLELSTQTKNTGVKQHLPWSVDHVAKT